MNGFDFSILTYLNSFVNRYPHLDALIVHAQHNNLLKGGVLIALCWYTWFRSAEKVVREKLIAGILAMIAGLIIARALAQMLPFRIRPLINPDLHFVMPDPNGAAVGWANWSSFPSDHAVVWFCVAASLYLINRTLGLAAGVYVVLLGLGRIYAGIHHPTDILFGAFIGIAAVGVFNSAPLKQRLITPVLGWSETQPGWFYAAAFLCSYEISNMFDEVRAMAPLLWHALKLIF